MNPLSAIVLLAAVIASASGYCYDSQVAADQYFDDTFVCKENIPHPAELIDSDLYQLRDETVHYFLDTATSCYNETGYYSRSYAAAGDYAYQCVCPSPRRRVNAVYVNKEICFVVYPEKQDIQYAQCGGHCSFDYGTKIATSSRGYFCVHQSYVQREFLVWCPIVPVNAGAASGSGHFAPARPQNHGNYQPYGRFLHVTKSLPTLCSCRGYFCDNHLAHVH